MTLSEKAMHYAVMCHESTNHLYGALPYSTHLNLVHEIATVFIHLIPDEDRDLVLAGCWVHDVIEDTRQTYNDVAAATSKEVAELAYALTNEKGRTRGERANEKYYEGIRNTKYATFIKLCDRLANIGYSIMFSGRMLNRYKEENEVFVTHLYDETYAEMFAYLNEEIKKEKEPKSQL